MADPHELELIRVWELSFTPTPTGQRRPSEALAAAQALAARLPDNRDLLYLQALNLRMLDRIPEALAALNQLEQIHPRCSRLFQERGQCYAVMRDVPKAIDAFSLAVRINSALPLSWQMLQRLDHNAAPAAAQHLATLAKLPPEVVEASSLFTDGFFLPAEYIIRAYLRKDPTNVGAMRLLARIGMELGALEEAESLLASVVKQAPDFHAARLDYAMALLRRQKYWPAREESQQLLKQDPNNREFLKLYGAACIGLGDHEPVIGLYEDLLKGIPQTGPEVSDLRLWRGNALKSTGRSQEAVADYHAALEARPDFAVAWFSLANLKTYRFTDAEITAMRALESQSAAARMDRCYLCFALGKALEDRADYSGSWQYYAKGNALMRAASNYRPDIAENNSRQLQQVFTAEFFTARAGWGAEHSNPTPIFIVGLPRSGSTLIEQILASHSQVEGTEELTEIERLANEVNGRNLTATDLRLLGERFVTETRVYRKTGRPFFIDKMPNNFWHIGLIQLMLPNAKIIDARREPMACCFGNLKQLFSTARQEFAYSIEDIASYYRTYLHLMSHWHRALPNRILTVQHEDIVADLEGSVRRILDYCGLPFEQGCVEFHQTRRIVRSASSEQVRQPISREGLEQWRHYEPWLGPLKDALGDALTRYKLV